MPAVVAGEAERDAPGDPPERIPEEELREVHLVDPGEPCDGDAHERDPASQEDCPVAVALKETISGCDRLDAVLLKWSARLEHFAADRAPQEIADVVADDRGGHADPDS